MRITLTDAGKRFNRDWIFRHLHYEFKSGHTYAIVGPNGSGKSTLLQAIAGAIGISEGKIAYHGTDAGTKISGTGSLDTDLHAGGGSKGNSPALSGEPSDRGNDGPLAGQRPGRDRGRLERADIGLSQAHPGFAGKEIAPDLVYRRLSIAAPYLEVIEEMTVTEFLHFHAGFKPLLPGWPVREIIGHVGLAAAAHKQIRFYSSGMRQRVRLAQAIFSDTPLVLLDEPCTNLDIEGIQLYRALIESFCTGRTVIVSSNDRQEYDFCEENINIMDHKP